MHQCAFNIATSILRITCTIVCMYYKLHDDSAHADKVQLYTTVLTTLSYMPKFYWHPRKALQTLFCSLSIAKAIWLYSSCVIFKLQVSLLWDNRLADLCCMLTFLTIPSKIAAISQMLARILVLTSDGHPIQKLDCRWNRFCSGRTSGLGTLRNIITLFRVTLPWLRISSCVRDA